MHVISFERKKPPSIQFMIINVHTIKRIHERIGDNSCARPGRTRCQKIIGLGILESKPRFTLFIRGEIQSMRRSTGTHTPSIPTTPIKNQKKNGTHPAPNKTEGTPRHNP